MISSSVLIWLGGVAASLVALGYAYFSGEKRAKERARNKATAERVETIGKAKDVGLEVDQMPADERREELGKWSNR